MQIGEFAKICRTRISVLRHYDKQGLLVPAYTDRFTGYRYYTEEQLHVFKQIAALKQAGFSLAEIKMILANVQSDRDILELFEKKQAELLDTLQHLEEAKAMMNEVHDFMKIVFKETADGLLAKSDIGNKLEFKQLCEKMDISLISQGYQRISPYRKLAEESANAIQAECAAVRLNEELAPLKDDIAIPFEDDPDIVGKWEIIGEYATKEDFIADGLCRRGWWGEQIKELYFLPNGQRYWCYGWTRGKLLFKNGDGSSVNEYTTQKYGNERYMFIEWKSYHYRRGGKPVILVLRQADNTPYTAKEIAKKDHIDLPFADDPRIIGTWHAYGSCRTTEEFDSKRSKKEQNYFCRIEFHENGLCACTYGNSTIQQTWTKGYIINKLNQTASGYSLSVLDGTQYLFVELKNGDYIWGGMEPQQIVFTKES